jgi:release factor glutamine methyltransferase
MIVSEKLACFSGTILREGMRLADLIKKGKETVSALYPEKEAGEMVFAYLEHFLGTKRHTHIVDPDYEVPSDKVKVARDAFARMAKGEPLQYITGMAWFYGRQFRVTPDVLIPRPETEILCQTALEYILRSRIQDPKVLDLCTGSGCIAWTVAAENNLAGRKTAEDANVGRTSYDSTASYSMQGAQVEAVDISDGALRIASSQQIEESVSVQFYKADVLKEPDPGVFAAGSYDVILSNPPYVMNKEKALMRANVLEHEPHLALFVSDDDPLIFYRAVARWAARLLKVGGYGLVEINEALGEQTAQVFREAGFSAVRVIKDFSDRDRFVEFTRIL